MEQVTLREYLQGIEDTLSSGDVDDAVHKCQHVLVQFPESLEVQRLLGEVYLAQGRMEDAQQALDWILTNDPENVIAYCDRALISEHLSDFDTALDCYQQAYELSRGNRHIRQQFNMLSKKAGQQGFMFSRAGLARLYMRGGLLPQAVQEWDAVLSVSPDRLDARTGLLEAYWREGLYDEAEQLALQILQDVSGCVKALLLLAHITAPKNMQQAKEYLLRAELLDPDLFMAQELFEDMMMSQPGHPFLKLLMKAPTVIDSKQVSTDSAPTQSFAELALAHIATSSEIARSVPEVSIHEMPTSVNFFEWNNGETWNKDVGTPTRPEPKERPVAETAALPMWSHDTFPSNEVGTVPVQQQEVQEQQQQEETPSAPPAWLSMLAQDEQRGQPGEAMPSMEHEQKQPSVEMPIPSAYQQPIETPSVDTTVETSWRNALQASLNTTDEEPFFFGPEWLKSLGAAEIDADVQEQPAPSPTVSPTQPEAVVHPSGSAQASDVEPMPINASVEESTFDAFARSNSLPADSQHSEQSEQTIVNTLEGLEHDLLTQGFVPLAPNSLSAIAQSKEQETSSNEPLATTRNSYEEESYQEPAHELTLSTALEQLGNLAAPHIQNSYQSPETFVPAVQEASSQPMEEPLWASGLRSVPVPVESSGVWRQTQHPEPAAASNVPMVAPTPVLPESGTHEQASLTLSAHDEAFPEPIFEATYTPQQTETFNAPVARTDTFFESELETTMKRPAVRLQTMRQPQQSALSSHYQQTGSAKARSSEPKSMIDTGGGKGGANGSQERLVKGYQHQLVGDYDEAMQEYRIIIKSAPELIGEVVSNVRALLKLAPRYSVGYRVLGDAYMRQGEYLQAMEAYNKALTMAKKAKV